MNYWIKTTLEDCPALPWANGFGLTQEVMTWPQRDDWVIRVSIAHIAQNAPYSVLPGTERWHTILKGKLALTIDQSSVTLDAKSEPFSFDGGVSCTCKLIEGPALALNTMTRGAAYRTRVYRISSQDFKPLSELLCLSTDELNRCTLIGMFSVSSSKIMYNNNIDQIAADQWIWSDRAIATRIEQTSLTSESAILVLLQRI
ncbi:HutD/Ves family protein [Orrella marina]|uniref:HutD family protein n=1 Tax=Orrella marina TaxID=2163011 RepID=A0A2R4XJP1_9BURK|nr:HutD family protein [Orrella marina]AWB34030.1 hypothetical protein DBV39_10235 [Orrella marina]